MHLRSPACRGAWRGTDESAAAHGPHEFYPHFWPTAADCPGWTEDEAYAKALADRLRGCPGGTRLEAHPAVLTAVSRLLEPDYPGESDHVEHQLTQLFGVPLGAAPLKPGKWRLVTADGTGWIGQASHLSKRPSSRCRRQPASTGHQCGSLPVRR